ncbi:MAG: tetratricopeptide repeat protein, partial [Ilumatobacteraceae bacterium]
CCGIVMTRSRPPATAPTEPTASTAPTASTRPQRQRAVAASVAAVTIAALALVAGTLDVAADRLARRALDAAPTTGVDDADRAVRLRPDDVRYRLVAAVVHSRRGSLADVDLALDQIDAARRWSANDPVVRDEHAVLLAQRASITGTTDDIAASLAAWRALVVSDPHRARWQLELGRAAALAGDVAQARAAWRVAADLDPSDPTAGNLLARLPDA